ncbi:hypothetical protein [Nocardiopsis potens]|uniref:hypothetical protein n=1 Tax=Nocardiopsis potens TaxID=1246458 RepID=UPI000344D668|nr:hypothetical protein [Nocardiopsis potens]
MLRRPLELKDHARGPFPLVPGRDPGFPEDPGAAGAWWWEVFGWRDGAPGECSTGLFPGLLMIGELGCGYALNLVFNGDARGRVVCTWNSEGPPLFAPEPDLPAWFETWLDLLLCDAVHPVWRGPVLRVRLPRSAPGSPLDGGERAREALLAGASGDGAGGDGPAPAAADALEAALRTDADPRVRLAAVCALSRGPGAAGRLRGIASTAVGDPADLARTLLAATAR